MRKRILAILVAIAVVAVPVALLAPPAAASPQDEYTGPYYGDGNFPPGCVRDMSIDNPANICHHMRTDMNGLDSPQVDVLVMVPVSPTAERDMRVIRQSVEMWEAGIDYLAGEMGLEWLASGLDFHITVDFFDPLGEGGGEFTTYPIVDPEIVIIATNPVGGAGIGVDPADLVFSNDGFTFTDENQVPCHSIENPFDFEYWENLPGFDRHHDERIGTYVEDCGGSGGNICFAVNGAIDVTGENVQDGGAVPLDLFDLVSHEFGHCLTIGHVGDGAEGSWGTLPSNDIMAYHNDPPALTKCVSTLNVEGVALQMSKYLDVNGDGEVAGDDRLFANDQVGDGRNPFQVQHPDDHLYASSTGSPLGCPQPDLGLVPGPRTSWTPVPGDANRPVMDITSPEDGAVSDDGRFDVRGTVERQPLQGSNPGTTASHDDAPDDATTPATEILGLDVEVTDTDLVATMRVAKLWPSTEATSATSYSLLVDAHRYESFVVFGAPDTYDTRTGTFLPAGTSAWDLEANTVTFTLPLDYLSNTGVKSPYYVAAETAVGWLTVPPALVDDRAPDTGSGLAVARATEPAPEPRPATEPEGPSRTVEFRHPAGNTFTPEDSNATGSDTKHTFTLAVPDTADVRVELAWTDGLVGNDLDLYVTGGGGDSGSDGAQAFTNPETVLLPQVKGTLTIDVQPYFVTDPEGTTYTLTANVITDADGDGLKADDECPEDAGTTPTGCPDADGDGVTDNNDVCGDLAGEGADGCPVLPTEFVHLYVDGAAAGTQAVDPANGPDAFGFTIDVPEGTHELRVDWLDDGQLVTSRSLSVTHDSDFDDDGVANETDVCPGFDDSLDADGDGIPDGCDEPQRVPTAPAIVSATPGNGAATLSWTAPANDGGTPIIGYRIEVHHGGDMVKAVNVAGSTLSTTVTGLANGTTYTFTVTAVNKVGAGEPSPPSPPVTPRTVPAAPTITSVAPGDTTATVAWAAPASDGGSPITSYAVTAFDADEPVKSVAVPGSARSTTVTGLTNGTAYTFTVTATNAAGMGAPSAAAGPVTPETAASEEEPEPEPEPEPEMGPSPAPPPSPSPSRARSGYWMVGSDGAVFAFGDAPHVGNATVGSAPAEDLEPTPTGNGYWVVDASGRVQTFGDAVYVGGVDGALAPGERVTSMSATPTGRGYWLFTTAGRVVAFGDAPHLGDMSGIRLNGPVLDSIPTPSGRGYYMVASDGGIFTFGDAVFVGSMGDTPLNAPVQSLVPDGDGAGYWLVASDGGIFAFDAAFFGSMGDTRLNEPITGMVGSGSAGYLMVAEDGGIFSFGTAPFHGSLGDFPPARPITSAAVLPR